MTKLSKKSPDLHVMVFPDGVLFKSGMRLYQAAALVVGMSNTPC